MKHKLRVQAESTTYTFVVLHDIASYALRESKDAKEGRFHNCLSAMLFCAFTLEAYLNHLGDHEFTDWASLEYGKKPREKLDLLLKHKGEHCDFRHRPFFTFGRIFAFRKLMVHGKTEHREVNRVQKGTLGARPTLPKTTWEREITLKNAEVFYNDTEVMITTLHTIFGYRTNPFSTPYRASWSTTPFCS